MKTIRQSMFMNRIFPLPSLCIALGSVLVFGEIVAENYEFEYCEDSCNNACFPQKNCSWQAGVDFLYWYSNITNLSYALEGKQIDSGDESPETVFVPIKKAHFDSSWNPGIRVGVSYLNNCSSWEVNSDWTYYTNCTNAKLSVPAFENSSFNGNQPAGTYGLKSPWLLTPNSDYYNKVSSNWEVTFNQLDIELARTFCACNWMDLRPHTGLRGYWTTIDFNVFASRPLRSEATLLQSTSRFTQKDWGLGFLIGVDATWKLNSCFSLFSETSAALAYGRQSIVRKSKEFGQNSEGETIRNSKATTEDVTYTLQPILDMALGVRWETLCNCYKVFIDVGWEFHYFYDMNQIFRSAGSFSSNEDLIPTNGSLGLSGLTVRGRIEF